MRSFIVIFALTSLLGLTGCVGGGQVSNDELASYIQAGSRSGVAYGIRYAVQHNPVKAPEILTDAKLAGEILSRQIQPIFNGPSTADILRSAVDTALDQLSSKLKPEVLGTIQIAIDLLATRVKLPANPVEKLDDRTKKTLLALFTGIAQGISDATGAVGPAAGPGDPVVNKLRWPNQ